MNPFFLGTYSSAQPNREWLEAADSLVKIGRKVDLGLTGDTVAKVRRFLDEELEKMKPPSMAVPLPDDFKFAAHDVRRRLIEEVVPVPREHDLPFAVMIGVRQSVKPELRVARDGVSRADVGALERIFRVDNNVCLRATYHSDENQHELCVAAPKIKQPDAVRMLVVSR
jgi:hypothetical protein